MLSGSQGLTQLAQKRKELGIREDSDTLRGQWGEVLGLEQELPVRRSPSPLVTETITRSTAIMPTPWSMRLHPSLLLIRCLHWISHRAPLSLGFLIHKWEWWCLPMAESFWKLQCHVGWQSNFTNGDVLLGVGTFFHCVMPSLSCHYWQKRLLAGFLSRESWGAQAKVRPCAAALWKTAHLAFRSAAAHPFRVKVGKFLNLRLSFLFWKRGS